MNPEKINSQPVIQKRSSNLTWAGQLDMIMPIARKYKEIINNRHQEIDNMKL